MSCRKARQEDETPEEDIPAFEKPEEGQKDDIQSPLWRRSCGIWFLSSYTGHRHEGSHLSMVSADSGSLDAFCLREVSPSRELYSFPLIRDIKIIYDFDGLPNTEESA